MLGMCSVETMMEMHLGMKTGQAEYISALLPTVHFQRVLLFFFSDL